MRNSGPFPGDEPADLDTQGVGEQQRRLGGDEQAALPSLESAPLPGAQPSSPLELALGEAEGVPELRRTGDDGQADSVLHHGDRVGTTGQAAQAERWFILAGDVAAAEYSKICHDGGAW